MEHHDRDTHTRSCTVVLQVMVHSHYPCGLWSHYHKALITYCDKNYILWYICGPPKPRCKSIIDGYYVLRTSNMYPQTRISDRKNSTRTHACIWLAPVTQNIIADGFKHRTAVDAVCITVSLPRILSSSLQLITSISLPLYAVCRFDIPRIIPVQEHKLLPESRDKKKTDRCAIQIVKILFCLYYNLAYAVCVFSGSQR